MSTIMETVKYFVQFQLCLELLSLLTLFFFFFNDTATTEIYTLSLHDALPICAVAAALLRGRTGTQAPPPGSPGQPPPADPGLVPLTVPEIKRITAALTARPLPAPLVVHWDAWTRRHQARARWFHQRARLKRDYALVS